jgi:sugar O-acyltransferase (sialic acid O-acetyltransferase NeuD family)
MAQVIIFGLRDFASLAHFYLKHDSAHDVVAFSVTRDYLDGTERFEGLPVVAFEDLEQSFPPTEYHLFAPLSHRNMNRLREQIFHQGKAKGYRFISYISSRATTFPGVGFGENCFILEDNTIQPFVRIGDNVVLWSGNHIGHHSTLGDHAFFTSHVVLSGHCQVGHHSFLGVNSTIKDGLNIAPGSLIAMGACVMQDTEEWGVYRGNPARKSELKSHAIDF